MQEFLLGAAIRAGFEIVQKVDQLIDPKIESHKVIVVDEYDVTINHLTLNLRTSDLEVLAGVTFGEGTYGKYMLSFKVDRKTGMLVRGSGKGKFLREEGTRIDYEHPMVFSAEAVDDMFIGWDLQAHVLRLIQEKK